MKKKSRMSTKTTAWILTAALLMGSCPFTATASEEKSAADELKTETVSKSTENSDEKSADKGQKAEKAAANDDVRNKAADLANEHTEKKTTVTKSDDAENDIRAALDEATEEATIESEASTEDEKQETVKNHQQKPAKKLERTKESSLYTRIENVSKACPTIEADGKVTFHYYPDDNEQVSDVYVKGSWDSSWNDYLYMTEDENGVWSVTTDKLSLEKSYEYGLMVKREAASEYEWVGDPTNPNQNGNAKIIRNPQTNSDGNVTIYYYPSQDEKVSLVCIDEDGRKQEQEMTKDSCFGALFSATVTGSGNYTYYFTVNGEKVEDVNCTDAKFSIHELPKDDTSVVSPVIKGDKVLFSYFNPTAKEVYLAGSMTNWSDGKKAMSYDKKTGFWTIELTLDPDDYQYKFIVDGSWILDPKNTNEQKDGNSAFTVTLSNENVKSPVIHTNNTTVSFHYYNKNAKSVALAGSMNGWNKDADFMTYDEATGLWSVSMKLDAGVYEYKFVVDGNDWKKDPCNKQTANGNSVFTIEEKEYTYHIYYYTKDFTNADEAAMWIWQEGGAGGIQYEFDSVETLDDNHKWLKADINIDLNAISIIPKAAETWNGQDVTKVFDNADDAKEITLYLVDDDVNVYTSIPDVDQKITYERYALVEYERPEGDYEGWNIYSWNTGIKSEYVADFEKIGNKVVFYLPVQKTKDSVSFCMRRSEPGNDWAEKDGGDHCVVLPLDQKVVKARFVQGEGVVENVAYNKGFETKTDEQKIVFYYRDDEKYLSYEEASLKGKVSLVYDGETYEMDYDEENERYTVELDLTAGDHPYAYKVDGELVLDQFNPETISVDNTTYSLFTYKTFEINPKASVAPSTINYNQNAVVTVSLGEDVPEDFTVDQITLDLSSLGLSNHFAIDPSLMEGTISVKDTIAAGKKTIPVTVKDSFGNIYKTDTTVTIKKKAASKDFDWDEAVIYFAVTDRFFDGDTSNNDAYGTGTYDKSQGSMYHGGDFSGLTQKLDYLQELGVNTVWITPIVENTEYVTDCDGYPGQHNAGYHGYWASDFTTLNKHLGTEKELKTLINELHKRGMKLMVDVVLNHAGYTTEDLFNNTYISGKNMLRDASNTINGDDKKGPLSGLPDFVTEDPEVSKQLVEWQTDWVKKYDIDYYRVDTVKHVDDVTWKEFKNELTKANPEFKMIGEYSGAGYATNFGQLGTGQMDALLDFDFNDKALDFCDGKLEEVEKFLENRNKSIDNTATMGSFIGSHDEDGFMYRLVKERGKNEKDAYALGKVAATLQITAKGQPIIYYGEELGQTGANNYPIQENRYDFAWDKVNDTNDMLSHYKTLLAIRNRYTDVFAKGTRQQIFAQNSVLVTKRAYGNQELLVGMNVDTQKEAEVVLNVKEANKTYTDLYSGKTYKTDSSGKLCVNIPGASEGGTVILKKETKSDISVDITPVVNTTDENKTVTIDTVATTPVVRLEQPVYKTNMGKIVKGWDQVIRAHIDEQMADMVPLASGILNQQKQYITIKLDKNVIRLIPQSAVKLMKESGNNFAFVITDDITYYYDQETLEKINGNLNLNIRIDTKKDFGQGFKSVVIDPVVDSKEKVNVPVKVNVGKENAGKVVFIFHRNIENQKVEPLAYTWVDAFGNIQVENAVYTDLIFLY